MAEAPPEGPLAVFAGGGALPRQLADAVRASGRDVFVLRIQGEADADFADYPADDIRYGEIGRALGLLKARECRSVVLAGRVDRPSLAAIRPDWGAVKLMPRIARMMVGGDDDVLRRVAALFDEHGLTLVSPLDIAPSLRAPAGRLVGPEPGQAARRDIAVGLKAARAIGALDAGQGVVVDGGRAIALEGIEGTDAVIARAGALRASGRWRSPAPSGVLVKAAKPQQDMRLDVPTIGVDTVRAAAAAGLAGIAIEVGRVLTLEMAEMQALADRHRLFLWGAE